MSSTFSLPDLAKEVNEGLSLPPTKPLLLRDRASGRFLVRPELANLLDSQGSRLDTDIVDIHNGQAAPKLGFPMEQGEHFEGLKADLNSHEHVSLSDITGHAQLNRAYGAGRKEMLRMFKFVDYHKDYRSRLVAPDQYKTMHEVSCIDDAKYISAISNQLAELVARRPGLAIDSAAPVSAASTKTLAKGVITLQAEAARLWGVDTSVDPSMVRSASGQAGGLYRSWTQKTDSTIKRKLDACKWTEGGLAVGSSPFSRTIPPHKAGSSATVDPLLVDDLTRYMLTSPSTSQQASVATGSKDTPRVITDESPAAIIRYRSTAALSQKAFTTAVTRARASAKQPRKKRHVIDYPVASLATKMDNVSIKGSRASSAAPSRSVATLSNEERDARLRTLDMAEIERLGTEYTQTKDEARRKEIAAIFGLDTSEVWGYEG